MKLIIVESPTKARTLGRFLDQDCQVLASMGHLRDLPKKKLAVDIEHDFKPTYDLVPKKEKTVKQLKTAAKKAEQIILATDPDREGEAIAYHTAWLLKKDLKSPPAIVRASFHEITQEAVRRSLENPGKINKNLVAAQQARRILDRLVGYKLSPLLWIKVRRGLSAGRVQSPALRLIVEREREIKAFRPEEYWLISVELKPAAGESFLAELVKVNDQLVKIRNQKEAGQIKASLEKAVYQVAAVKSRALVKSPPPPFITSTLQRTASNFFHWSAKKTIFLAQKLYERGLITYHRTDSVHLAQSAVQSARKYIKDRFGDDYLPEKPRRFKVKSKLAQEAHEAIRPTNLNSKFRAKKQTGKVQSSKLNKNAQRLYELIFNRFIACQMKNQLLERVTIEVEAKQAETTYWLKARGETEKFSGWKEVYRRGEKLKSSQVQKEVLLKLRETDKLKALKVLPEQKFTQPPPRYSEGGLIKALEKKGIGRPSTYASIISTLKMRNYVEKIEGFFQPTPVGETVNDFLVKYFDKVVDYDFTAEMEDDLDKIAGGEKKWVPTVRQFYQPFAAKLARVKKKAKRQKIEVEKIGKKCPQCQQGEQVIRIGRYGKFLSCSRFPDCDWKKSYVQKLKGFKCPDCGGQVIIKKTKKGRKFYGCSNYPQCKWAVWKKPKKETSTDKAKGS